MLKILKATAVLLMGWLLPGFALAERLDPGGGRNAWDYFVYGNGPAIFEILTSLKLMLAPDSGEPVFKYIMLFLAVVGFVILAAKAGFNPQQNFLKMFSFLLVVWFVNYATTGLKANVNVVDRLNGYSNVVTGVPAIVAIPASVVSQIGEWMTRQIEQNFSIPGAMTMSGGGQYNLMGKVMGDADKVMFTDDSLKRTVSSYISNCMVPAMAMGRVSLNDLTKSKNLVDTLSLAQHNSLSTMYFKPEGRDDPCIHMTTGLGLGGADSCARVFTCMREDLTNHADALVDAGAESWSKSGVFVPLEEALSTALSLSGSNVGTFAGYGRPQGYILQRAMLSHMGGAFRSAATMTGNNELMMSTSIAQAEQSQRTAWAVAAEIFTNMMGYVYIVLQAFILAIVPIVIISLMIPGLGGKVLVNYGQILIWLTLWSPMLAIINFLIVLFWQQQMSSVGLANGLDMYNSGLMTAQTANLQIAAQFLGTMVPILTWGLVKGSMAFTEFISSGIGSSFATQAGAQAATGNVSMGNLSMDNVGMNKYNTAMSATVGTQDTLAFYNAATSTSMLQGGGSAVGMNGGTATRTAAVSDSAKDSMSTGADFTAQTRFAQSKAMAAQDTMSEADSRLKMLEKAYAAAQGATKGRGGDTGDSVQAQTSNTNSADATTSQGASTTTAVTGRGNVGINLNRDIGRDKNKNDGGGGNNNQNASNQNGDDDQPRSPYSAGATLGADASIQRADSAQEGANFAERAGTQTQMSANKQAQVKDALGTTKSSQDSFRDALSYVGGLSVQDIKSITDSLTKESSLAKSEFEKYSYSLERGQTETTSMPRAILSIEEVAPATSRDQITPNAYSAAVTVESDYRAAGADYDQELKAREAEIAASKQEILNSKPTNDLKDVPTYDGTNTTLDNLARNGDRMAEFNQRITDVNRDLVNISKQDINVQALSALANSVSGLFGDRLGMDAHHEKGLDGIISMNQRVLSTIGEKYTTTPMTDADYTNISATITALENQVKLQIDEAAAAKEAEADNPAKVETPRGEIDFFRPLPENF